MLTNDFSVEVYQQAMPERLACEFEDPRVPNFEHQIICFGMVCL